MTKLDSKWTITIISVIFALIFATGFIVLLYILVHKDKIPLKAFDDIEVPAAAASIDELSSTLKLLRQEQMDIVDFVNSNTLSWKARFNPFTTDKMPSEFKSLVPESEIVASMKLWADPTLIDKSVAHADQLLNTYKHTTIPEHFDSRLRWPFCPTIHQIHNQGGCGSCWAVSFAASVSDRTCIYSNGSIKFQLSSQDVIECCKGCNGCSGSPSQLPPHRFWLNSGLVTGGQYESFEGCKPYEFSAYCGSPCPSNFYVEAAKRVRQAGCKIACRNHYNTIYQKDKHYASTIYYLGRPRFLSGFLRVQEAVLPNWELATGEDNFVARLAKGIGYDHLQQNFVAKINRNVSEMERILQLELMTHGPFVACFIVYKEFAHYFSGIYVPTPRRGSRVYGHCVKIIGWGTEHFSDPVQLFDVIGPTHYTRHLDYWIVANTWGTDWGESGFFRIVRGHEYSVNELYLYDDVVTGIPASL